MIDACAWAYGASKSVFVFASQSISLNDEDSDIMKLKSYLVDSWTEEEYRKALSAQLIRDEVKALQGLAVEPNADSEWFKEQYFYAGGSARFMFGYCVEDNAKKGIRTRLNRHIEACNDYGSLFRIGPKSSDSVNHLYCHVEDRNFVLSQYVAQRVGLLVKDSSALKSVVSDAYHIARGLSNPAFWGWVLEMDFMAQLRLAKETHKKIDLLYPHESASKCLGLDVRNIEDWSSKTNGSRVLRQGRTFEDFVGDWFIPQEWNQAAFDAISFQKDVDGNVKCVFVQVTWAKKHDLKIRHLKSAIELIGADVFKLETAEFYFVGPLDWSKTFTLSPETKRSSKRRGLTCKIFGFHQLN